MTTDITKLRISIPRVHFGPEEDEEEIKPTINSNGEVPEKEPSNLPAPSVLPPPTPITELKSRKIKVKIDYLSILLTIFSIIYYLSLLCAFPSNHKVLNFRFIPRTFFFICTLIISVMTLVGQIIFQIVLVAAPQREVFESWWVKELGFVDFTKSTVWDILQYILIDLAISLISLAFAVVSIVKISRELQLHSKKENDENDEEKDSIYSFSSNQISTIQHHFVNFGFFIAGCSHISFISLPYFILFFLYLIVWVFRNRLNSLICIKLTGRKMKKVPSWLILTIWVLISIYTIIILLLILLSRFSFSNIILDPSHSASKWLYMVGFFKLNFNPQIVEQYQYYTFFFSLFYIYVIITLFFHRYLIKKDIQVTDVDQKKKESLLIYFTALFPWLRWFPDNSPRIVLFIFLTFSLAYPSVFSFIWLIYVCFGLLIPIKLLRNLMPIALIYSLITSLVQFAFYIPNVWNHKNEYYSLTQVMLRQFGLIGLFNANLVLMSQCLIAYFASISVFENKIKGSSFTQKLSIVESIRRRSNATRFTVLWDKFKGILKGTQNILYYIFAFIIAQSYILTLAIVYIACLYPNVADIFHLFYLIFFITLFVFPNIVKRCWILLVMYSEIVTLSLYIFNVVSGPTNRGPIYELIGLIRFPENNLKFFNGLVWHIIILVLSSIQLHVLQATDFNMDIFKMIEEDLNSLIGNERVLSILSLWSFVKNIFQMFFTKFFMYICIIVMVSSVLSRNDVSVIYLLFLVLIFVAIFLSVLRDFGSWKLVSVFWIVIVIYSGIVFLATYIYQFTYVNTIITEWTSKIPVEWRLYMEAKDIGLYVFDNKATGLLNLAVILLLNIIQLKNFTFRRVNAREVRESVKMENGPIDQVSEKVLIGDRFSQFYSYAYIIFQRVIILHMPKVTLIILFIASNEHKNIIGLFYFLSALIYIPIPQFIIVLWFVMMIYSQVVILLQYVYQFPFFLVTFGCNRVGIDPSVPCQWFNFIGFYQKTSSNNVFTIIYMHFWVLLVAFFLRTSLKIKSKMKDKYVPGKIFDPLPVISSKQSWIQYLQNIIIFLGNRLFYSMGFEISLLTLLISSLFIIKTIWGLIYLILFGVCLLFGKRYTSKGWRVIMFAIIVNIFILYIFSIVPVPYEPLDIYKKMNEWIIYRNYLKSYFILKPTDQTNGLFINLYVILFFVSLQLSVFINSPKIMSKKTPTEKLYLEQNKMKQTHVQIQEPPGRDFTKSRIWYDILLRYFYTVFPYIIILLMFIQGTFNISVIGILQISICFFYLNLIDTLFWKGNRFWIWVGFSFWFILILRALYQIPIVLLGDYYRELEVHGVFQQIIGLKEISSPSDIWIEVIILIFYYIQTVMFDSEAYAFYINFQYHNTKQSEIRYDRNVAFRAEKMMEILITNLKEEERRKENLKALKITNFNTIESDKELYEKYKEIRYKELKEVSKELKSAFDEVSLQIKQSKILQSELLASQNKYEYLDQKIRKFYQEKKDKKVKDEGEGKTPLSGLKEPSKIFEALNTKPEEKKEEKAIEVKKEESKFSKEKILEYLEWIDSWITWGIDQIISLLDKHIDIVDDDDADITHNSNIRIRSMTMDSEKDFEEVTKSESLDGNEGKEKVWKDDEKIEEKNDDEKTDDVKEDVKEKKEEVTIEDIKEELKEIEAEPTPEEPKEDQIIITVKPEENNVEKKEEEKMEEKVTRVFKFNIRNSIKKLVQKLKLFGLSHSDNIVYLSFILLTIVNPTIYNVLFVISAFAFAAYQYPYPPQIYWNIVAFTSQLFVALEYTLKLVQIRLVINTVDRANAWQQIFGWNPSTDQNLFTSTSVYFLMIVLINLHKNSLRSRGDWVRRSRVEIQKTLQNTKVQFSGHLQRPNEVEITVEQPIVPQQVQEEGEKVLTFFKSIYNTVVPYFQSLVDNKNKVGSDYYFITVSFELLSYAIFLLTFQYFTGRDSDDITGSITSNELPGTMVYILIALFAIMIIDRIIYIYTSLKWKLVFHIFLVFGYSIVYLYVYVYLRSLDFNTSNGQNTLKILFLLKSIYLLLSCSQLSYGYSETTHIARLTKIFNWGGYYLYEGWRKVPFLYELKTLLDWTFTPTALTFYYWIKLEDIHATLYRRKVENDYWKQLVPQRQVGEKQTWLSKAFGGFLLFSAIVTVIFVPLFIFSSAAPVQLKHNSVTYVRVKVGISGFEPFYMNQYNLETILPYEYKLLDKRLQFSGFDPNLDLQNLDKISSNSENFWIISDPSRENLVKYLREDSVKKEGPYLTNFKITYDITRLGPPTLLTISASQDLKLTGQQRSSIADSITNTNGTLDTLIPFAYNPFLYNRAGGVRLIKQNNEEPTNFFPNCSLSIRAVQQKGQFWYFTCEKFNPQNYDQKNITGPFFIVQSSKIAENQIILGFISNFGIITFYTTIVLAVGNLIRIFLSGLVERIFYEDLDNVELLYGFVMDIYAARHYGDHVLEESMFLQLLRIYKNQSLLQIWGTKEKVD